eukprot:c31201_g1_i1 orf=1-150(-)
MLIIKYTTELASVGFTSSFTEDKKICRKIIQEFINKAWKNTIYAIGYAKK